MCADGMSNICSRLLGCHLRGVAYRRRLYTRDSSRLIVCRLNVIIAKNGERMMLSL